MIYPAWPAYLGLRPPVLIESSAPGRYNLAPGRLGYIFLFRALYQLFMILLSAVVATKDMSVRIMTTVPGILRNPILEVIEDLENNWVRGAHFS